MTTTMKIPVFVIILQDADAAVFDTADDTADSVGDDTGGNEIH